MKTLRACLLLALVACGSSPPETRAPDARPAPSTPAAAVPKAAGLAAEKLASDTPKTTLKGATFVAPAGWSLSVRGPATILEAPEGDSWLALVDVEAKDADSAVAAAWAAYKPGAKWPLKSSTAKADKDGWSDQRNYEYQTSPNERRDVEALAKRSAEGWTVVLLDVFEPTGGKRFGQLMLVLGRLLPKGYKRESFAGRKANVLDAKRIAELGAFVERAQKDLGVPGVSVGLVQDGKTVFAGGFGVRELGKPAKASADTLYLIASNTKALTTLLLAKLVDEKKLTWETPVTKVLPQFRLGDVDTTSRVLVKHLVCACTGLPRQDYEWLFEYKSATPSSALATLGTMQPTSKFGEMFQYSNPLAAAGGYVAAYVHDPRLELGAGYDQAMRARVFEPLGMKATTFDFKKALAADHASAHGLDVDDKPAQAIMDLNYAVVPVRPAGGAWSNVNDMLAYVKMELAKGALPDGKRYISEGVLLERRAPQVPIGQDETYGMGLEVNTTYGIPVVHHGGSLIGYRSDMMWLPDHGVGAVVLTNSDAGTNIVSRFQRKLLEVLFDGHTEADADLATRAKAMHESILAERKLLTVPADKDEAAKLAPKYQSPVLGEIRVGKAGDATIFDFGEWKTPVATRKNPDGTTSFVVIGTGLPGIDFVPRASNGKRALVVRDAQHEYEFVAD
jgi:CubicO group peptidase (beta-lactamase class C family)